MGPALRAKTAAVRTGSGGHQTGEKSNGQAGPVTDQEKVLDLQKQAGNRAVSQLLADQPPTVQRLLKTKPSDLDKDSLAGKLGLAGAAKGSSSPANKLYADIRRLLTDYRARAALGGSTPTIQSAQLEHIDDLCAEYITRYGKGQASRVKILEKLQFDLNTERAAVTKREAGAEYQTGVEHADPSGMKKKGADAGAQKGFKALGSASQAVAVSHGLETPMPNFTGPKRDERIKLAKAKYGLTDAEISAISIYSAGDYTYINPVTANSASWLSGQRAHTAKSGAAAEGWAKQDDQTVKEEGSLHAAMAVQGLNKMKPYKGKTYRGARYTPTDFQAQFRPGQTTTFGALGSSSKEADQALEFAYYIASASTADPDKTVGVLTTVLDSGGRDISGISMSMKEAEVLILPDTTFEVVSVNRVGNPNKKFAQHVASATKLNKPLPTEFYAVTIKRVPTPSRAKAPVTRDSDATPARRRKPAPWKAASSAGATDQTALPSAPGTLGLDRKRADRAFDVNLASALKKLETANEQATDALAAADAKAGSDELERRSGHGGTA
jgi:hypothetical protein